MRKLQSEKLEKVHCQPWETREDQVQRSIKLSSANAEKQHRLL
jgi:hypothetical protein